MIKYTDDTRYAFVNGIIRSREARLLTRGHFDRLIAGDLASFHSILSDTHYSGYDDIQTALDTEDMRIEEFLRQYCMNPEVIQFIEWPEQIHNVKVSVKKGSDSLLYESAGNEVETWPEVQSVIEQYVLDKDPFILSTKLDKVLCSYLHGISGFCPFFAEYFTLHMDLENIRNFFRARQFEKSREIFDQVYLPHGTLTYELFAPSLETEIDHVSRVFFTTPYYHLIERGALYLEQHRSFLHLERLIEEKRLYFLKQARHMTFGVEPLFGFYHFKRSEIRKLQQVYWGKLNEVPVQDLKESIPDVW